MLDPLEKTWFRGTARPPISNEAIRRRYRVPQVFPCCDPELLLVRRGSIRFHPDGPSPTADPGLGRSWEGLPPVQRSVVVPLS
jgi:hypothetical protein